MSNDDVVGTVEVEDADGKFTLPEKFVDEQIVIRDPGTTVQIKINPPINWWYYNPEPDQNPNLAPDRVSLKVHGEPAEVYRVEGVERIDTSDGDK